MPKIGTPTERFWRHVEKRGPDECWNWTGSTSDGYGVLFIKKGTRVLAHKFSYRLANGDPPPGTEVIRHTCDNRRCVNPKHLLAGAILDNVRDRQERNRQAKGESIWKSKLTQAQVEEIRRIYVPYRYPRLKDLAEMYGVTLDQIHRIASKKSWRHV